MENNKHLVRVGHEFAAAMSDETPIITIAKMVTELASALDVQTARSEALAAENAALKGSRSILSENAFETCNEVYTAGFRNTALHDGLMESTGNRNKYPNPIRTLVDEAKRNIETPATDAFLAEVRAQGVEMFARSLRGEAEITKACTFKPVQQFEEFAYRADECAAQLRGNGNGGAA
ncbi:hypothetical protein [Atlantibacter hermannii]|uniref:hypothetical protein n=1 Tax=Atlantibacter hermannii TaxID=565 RepID=UPI0028A88051|nr:hypothetical protein [Atlantibacter hermannii]